MNKQGTHQKEAMTKLTNIENTFVSELTKSNLPLVGSSQFGGLEDGQLRIIEEIYDRRNVKSMRGKEASELYAKIWELSEEKSFSQLKEVLNSLFDVYDKALQKFVKEIGEFKKNICGIFANRKNLENKPFQFSNDPTVIFPKEELEILQEQLKEYEIHSEVQQANC